MCYKHLFFLSFAAVYTYYEKMRVKSNGKFDAEEYLRLLQEAGTEKKRGGCPQSTIRGRFTLFSTDPVEDDRIWYVFKMIL